jgi:hypothetical protein
VNYIHGAIKYRLRLLSKSRILFSMTNATQTNKLATKELIAWFKTYNWNRGGVPGVGISMFSVLGLGIQVQVTLTGQCIAYFSSRDAASLALSKADRAIRSQ